MFRNLQPLLQPSASLKTRLIVAIIYIQNLATIVKTIRSIVNLVNSCYKLHSEICNRSYNHLLAHVFHLSNLTPYRCLHLCINTMSEAQLVACVGWSEQSSVRCIRAISGMHSLPPKCQGLILGYQQSLIGHCLDNLVLCKFTNSHPADKNVTKSLVMSPLY
jgi:hypothetical protein